MLVTEETKEAAATVESASVSPSKTKASTLPSHPDQFLRRHIGPNAEATRQMLELIGCDNLEGVIDKTVPAQLKLSRLLPLPAARSEHQVLTALREIAAQNRVCRSYIGMGYYDCITPAVIQRNLLENPGWYTQYTPYQAEIAQGRLESLLNFQTMITDLTGMDIANASLLDEGTAAAEAMHLCQAMKPDRNVFLVSSECHPQTIDIVKTRALPLGITVEVGDHRSF